MIDVKLRPQPPNGAGPHYFYRVAQHDLLSDLALPALSGFKQTPGGKIWQAKRIDKPAVKSGGSELYQGPGWIGNAWRQVSGWSFDWGYRIDVAGIGVFEIAEDGNRIVLTKKEEGAGRDLVVEAILGPALIVSLAVHGVYCLHASGVLIDGHAVAFVAESGKGKSTLARWLGTQMGGSWRRIGDDILPLSISDRGVDVLPHFPQLKVPADKQPSSGLPERLPLAAVYVLDRPAEGAEVEIRPLGTQDGALALVRHTVASRLFDGDLLVKHLDFSVQAASQVPVRKLIYPLTPDALPVVQEVLSDDIQSREVSSRILATHNS